MWRHLKSHRGAVRWSLAQPKCLELFLSSLRRLQKLPDTFRGVFYALHLRYIF